MISFIRKIRRLWALDREISAATEKLAALEHVCESVAQTLADSERRLKQLNNEIEAAKEQRHHILTNALLKIKQDGFKIRNEERRKALVLAHSIVKDAEITADKLMAGAESYAAAMRANDLHPAP